MGNIKQGLLWALKQLKKGNKVRRNSWGKKCYIYALNIDFEDDKRLHCMTESKSMHSVFVDSDDWELYGEPEIINNCTKCKYISKYQEHCNYDGGGTLNSKPLKAIKMIKPPDWCPVNNESKSNKCKGIDCLSFTTECEGDEKPNWCKIC